MVTTKFYLDTRKVLKGGQGFSLRINITQNRNIASYPLGISLTDPACMVGSPVGFVVGYGRPRGISGADGDVAVRVFYGASVAEH